MSLKILHISDLHGNLKPLLRTIKKGLSFDWIVLSGDLAHTHIGYISERGDGYRKIDVDKESKHQREWAENALKPLLDKIPHRHSIIVNGNHDFCDYKGIAEFTLKAGSKTIEIDGMKVGLAVGIMPLAYEWHEEKPDYEFNQLLLSLDPAIEVLITHAPPNQVLDMAYGGQAIGYQCLYKNIFGLSLAQMPAYFTDLKLHMFGHAHESADVKMVDYDESRKIIFSNAACQANILDFNT